MFLLSVLRTTLRSFVILGLFSSVLPFKMEVRIDGSYSHYPIDCTNTEDRADNRFLYYFFCLCKSFKELFLFVAIAVLKRKRMQRYGLFWNLQTFPETFSQKSCFFLLFLQVSPFTPYYII